MIPLRDTTPAKNYPVVNNAIIGINVVIFILQLSQGAEWNKFVFTFGLVPARYSIPQISAYFSAPQQVFSFVTFMFLHGGIWHLLGNMWSLFIFGDNVEDRLGPLRYLMFYLICGVASGGSHLLLNWHSNLPTIGASGAIAGVMGAYFILHPRSKILTLIPIFFIPYFIEIPAYFFLGIWFLLQFINAAAGQGQAGGVAWWAHIGGFIFGIIFLKILLALPGAGPRTKIRRVTARKKTPHLQVIRPIGPGPDPHLYGVITISPHEAAGGTRKLVNIPWGFRKRLFRVSVPPGIKEGSRLRLKGLGKDAGSNDRGGRGNLYLKVRIQ
ncbi:FIG056164: rhomboid family serine protease [Olavius sp. associated proteobacterium Delta 1]|nr:FIG056164: rhomboid family serine protease [Olavius sp. associated proteobacterium Delta 1]